MADQWTPEQLKAMYPRSPSMGRVQTLAEKVGLSTYQPRRAAQIAYGNSPSMWPAEPNHEATYRALESLLAETAARYPLSAARLCQPEINAAVEQVNSDLRALDAMAAQE